MTPPAAAPSTAPAVGGADDATGPLAGAWRCSPTVQLRPEPFGALVYDFDTRRLSFLRSPLLVDAVRALEGCSGVEEALDRADVPPARRPAFRRALAGLADSGTIVRREIPST